MFPGHADRWSWETNAGSSERGLHPRVRSEAAEQLLGDERHVLGALAQRGERDLHHREPEVEVGAEAAGVHLGAKVAVGGGDDPDVHRSVGVGAEPPDLPRLQHAQQLGLELERAARRSRRGRRCRRGPPRTRPRAGSVAPVKAPFSWPNSSDSRRLGGSAPQSTTRNELVPPARLAVDGFGGLALAGAGLALEEHGDVRRRRALHQREAHPRRHRAAHQRAEARCAPRAGACVFSPDSSKRSPTRPSPRRLPSRTAASFTSTPSRTVPLRLPRSLRPDALLVHQDLAVEARDGARRRGARR